MLKGVKNYFINNMGNCFSNKYKVENRTISDPFFKCEYCNVKKSDQLYGIECQKCKKIFYLHLMCYLKTSICSECYKVSIKKN